MGAGMEGDLSVLGERVIDEYGESIEDPEWRHRTQLAVGEQVFKLIFNRESHMVGHEYVSQATEIHVPTRRQHGHHESLIHLHDHDLSHLLLRSMEHMGNFRGTKRFRVGQYLIMNMLTIEILFECT